jgi:hypothetical protein
MAQETIERRFTVTGPARLKVSNIRGAVDVQPGEDGIVSVVAVKYTDSGDAGRTEVEIVQAEDGSVRAKTHFTKGWWWLFDWRQPCKVDYTIRVPRSSAVRVRGVSSEASVQGIEGEFDVKSVSGALRLQDLTGRVRAHSVSGAISGEKLDGPADLDTVSGKIRLTGSNLPAVEASSVSGDIVLETPLGEGPYRFKTVSGDVELIVPAESRCTIETSTVSGRFQTTMPLTRSWHDARRHGAEVQGGGTLVSLNSVSGDLRVTAGPGEAAPAPTAAAGAPPAPTAEPATPGQPGGTARRAILERIARGEITAEQGVIELKKLQG